MLSYEKFNYKIIILYTACKVNNISIFSVFAIDKQSKKCYNIQVLIALRAANSEGLPKNRIVKN